MGPNRLVFIALTYAITMVSIADRQSIALLKPALDHDFGWSRATYASVMALAQGVGAVALLFSGVLVDRIGVKRGLALGLGGWSAAAVAHAFARNVAELTVARAALGAFEALGTPGMMKGVAALFPPGRRTVVLGVINVAPNLAAIATPLAIAAMYGVLGWRATVGLLGASGFVCLAAWLAYRLPAARDDAAVTPRSLAGLLRKRELWGLGLAKALSDQGWWFLLTWLPDILHRHYGLSIAELSRLVAVIYAAAALGALGGGALPGLLARAGVQRTRLAALGVSATFVLPVAVIPAHPPLAAAIALLSLGLAAHQSFSTNLFALISETIEAERVASATGFCAFCGNLAGMAIIRAAGIEGALPAMFAIVAVGYWAAVGVLALLVRSLRAPPRGLEPRSVLPQVRSAPLPARPRP